MSTVKYSEQFKADALELAEREGCPEAARALGLHVKNIYNWRRAKLLKDINGRPLPKGLLPGETVEQGYKRAIEERDKALEANTILQKALGFLASR
jgi:transposase-like protein